MVADIATPPVSSLAVAIELAFVRDGAGAGAAAAVGAVLVSASLAAGRGRGLATVRLDDSLSESGQAVFARSCPR